MMRNQLYTYGLCGLALCCLLCATLPSQGRRALRALKRGKYAKSEALLQDMLRQDTLNPSAYYVYAQLYSTPRFSQHHMDTAYRYIQKALQQWQYLDTTEQELHKKYLFDSARFMQLQLQIDSTAYVQAESLGTLAAYTSFLSVHVTSVQRLQALHRRDSLAFVATTTRDDLKSYRHFMADYPDAPQQPAAHQRYAQLRFESTRKQPTLHGLEAFLKEFPQSDYLAAVHAELLKLLTLEALPVHFLHFIKTYPNSPHATLALQLLASIDKQWHDKQYAASYLSLYPAYTDSLRARAHAQVPLVPIYITEGKYSFIDHLGKQHIAVQCDSLPDTYLCEGVHTSYLQLHRDGVEEIRDISGQLVLKGKIEDVYTLADDLLCIHTGEHYGLWHLAAGELLPPIYDDITYLPSGLLRLEINEKLGISSLLGKELLPAVYTDIDQIGPFLILKQDTTTYVTQPAALSQALQAGTLPTLQRLDDVEVLEDKYLLAEKNGRIVLLDSSLQVLIPDAGIQPEHIDNYWLIEKDTHYLLFDEPSCTYSDTLLQVTFNRHWLRIQLQNKRHGLLTRGTLPDTLGAGLEQQVFMQHTLMLGYDSIRLVGNHLAVGRIGKRQWLHFPNVLPQEIPSAVHVYALNTPKLSHQQSPQAFYLRVKDNAQTLIDEQGHSTGKITYSHITPLTGRYLIVEAGKTKKGIIDHRGDVRVPLIHKTISYSDKSSQVSLQHGKMFGAFDAESGTYLAASYASVPIRFGDVGWQVVRDNKTGVIKQTGKVLIPFLYAKLHYWNRRYYLAKKAGSWWLHSFKKNTSPQGPFADYQLVTNNQATPSLLLKEEKGWGLMGSQGKWLIPPIYADILAVGRKQLLLFLATRYVTDAGLHLQIYFSTTGKRLFAQTYPKQSRYAPQATTAYTGCFSAYKKR